MSFSSSSTARSTATASGERATFIALSMMW
jgi:hypothetical protein